jgi:hypothetical protein
MSHYSHHQKYDLDNLPSFTKIGCVIEQEFLRHITTGEIPHLDKYLGQLNQFDWTCLLATNPRQEFIDYLNSKIPHVKSELDWRYIFECQPELRNIAEFKDWL